MTRRIILALLVLWMSAPLAAATTVRIVGIFGKTLKIGDIELRNVEAGVIDTPLPFALLGGSFLNRMEMKRDGNTLILTQRY